MVQIVHVVQIAALSFLACVKAGGILAVTWEDCGISHAKVTDVQPTAIVFGSTTTITIAGVVDEDVDSGFFTMVIAGGEKCYGNATSDITCNIPFGGKIVLKAVEFPIKAGNLNIKLDVTTPSIFQLPFLDFGIHADDGAGSLICMDVSAKKSADVDCSKSACPSQCTCSLLACTDTINTCLADATCAASQACALECACSDQSCMLNCATAGGSSQALPVATCITSNCAAVLV